MKANIFTLLTIVILLSGCAKDKDFEEEESLDIPVHTTIVYMMGENSLSSCTESDINEMLQGSRKSTGNDNLVVYVDKANDESSDGTPKIFNIKYGMKRNVTELPEQNSCDGNVFQNILTYIRSQYPAETYSLVMWSHGTGWIPEQKIVSRAVGVDNEENTASDIGCEMEISAMREAIENSGLHFQWILFDACYMQSIEVAYELKDVADYIIASPTELPSDGAPYNTIVPYFSFEDGKVTANRIAQGIYDNYKDAKVGILLSVVQSSELNKLADLTSSYFDTVPDVNDPDSLQPYGTWAYKHFWRPEYYDMGSIMKKNLNSVRYSYWRKQLEKAVPVRLYTTMWATSFNEQNTLIDEDAYTGVSMFLPADRYKEYGYNDEVKKTLWWRRVFQSKPSDY